MVPPRSSGRLPAPLNPASPRLRPRAPLAARVPRFALAPLVALVLLLVPGPALAQDAPAGEAGQHLAQAQQFVKNKWFDDAATEIEAALAAPGGMDSFEVAWTGAQIYYELAKMDRAATLAARAAAIAPEAGLRDRAAALRDYLTQSWGQLSVTAPYPGMTSRLQVDGGPGLLDADARRLVNRITLSLRDNTPLPVTVFLPSAPGR